MKSAMTSKSVYGIVRQHLRKQQDLGIGKAVLDGVLEPANPFDSRTRRTARRWFVLFAFIGGALLGCFVYFNNLV
jgi:hypothetical protein